ncbi:MAG: NAD(P)H-dependent oxidoreductase [Patescibacteria group bacterium]
MLIIYSHPNKKGHSGEYLKQLEEKLKEKEIKYDILDLYQIKFDPVLYPNEHYVSGNKNISEKTKEIQKRIKKENKFIFIYPTWWNNMPAILKGFFDKVFVGNFAFEYINHRPIGLLKGKAVIFSSSGAPRIWAKFIAKDRALKSVTKDILKFCNLKAKAYLVGWANELNEKQKKKISKVVKKGLKYLNN